MTSSYEQQELVLTPVSEACMGDLWSSFLKQKHTQSLEGITKFPVRPQTFMGHFLSVRPCARCWGYNDDQRKNLSVTVALTIKGLSVGRTDLH